MLRRSGKQMKLCFWYMADHGWGLRSLPVFHRRSIWFIALMMLIMMLFWLMVKPNPGVPINQARRDEAPVLQFFAALHQQATLYPAKQVRNDKQPSDLESEKWREYQIQSGQALVVLFREQQLPLADIYALERVEGQGNPLSRVQPGQRVRIRFDSAGVVTGLAIETKQQGTVLFVRQATGKFLRVR